MRTSRLPLVVVVGGLAAAGCGGGDAGPEPAPDARVPVEPSCVLADDGTVTYGTAGADELLDLVIGPDGQVHVAGYEAGVVGNTNLEPSGDAAGVIWRLDPASLEVRQRWSLDTTSTDVVEALALTPSGDALWWAGRSNGAMPGHGSYGQFDVVVGRVGASDELGVLQRTGSERPQHPRRLALAGEHALVVAGYDDIFVPTNYVASFENPFATRWTIDGDQLAADWTVERRRDQQSEVWLALAADADTIAVGGATMSGAGAGMYVRSLGHDARVRWERKLSSIGLDMVAALHVLGDGDLVWAGTTAARLGAVQHGGQDIVVGRLAGDSGEVVWIAQLGSARSDWVTDMAVDPEGRIYVVGETLIEGAAGGELHADALLYLLDGDGVELDARTWGGPGDDVPAAVAVDPCGTALVVGYTTSDLAGPSRGSRDGFATVVRRRG